MTLPSLLRRVQKIEVARRPPRGLFFVAFGGDPDEIEAAIGRARRSRTIDHGDPIVRCAWPDAAPVPPARWVSNTFHALDHIEFEALSDEIEWLEEAMQAEAGIDLARIEQASAQGGGKERAFTDAALIAPVLAVSLGAERASLNDDRLLRVARFVAEVSLRVNEGADGHAAHWPTKH